MVTNDHVAGRSGNAWECNDGCFDLGPEVPSISAMSGGLSAEIISNIFSVRQGKLPKAGDADTAEGPQSCIADWCNS